MTSQLLDRSCGGPAHREVRTKRVPEHMHAVVLDVTTPGCPRNCSFQRRPKCHRPAKLCTPANFVFTSRNWACSTHPHRRHLHRQPSRRSSRTGSTRSCDGATFRHPNSLTWRTDWCVLGQRNQTSLERCFSLTSGGTGRHKNNSARGAKLLEILVKTGSVWLRKARARAQPPAALPPRRVGRRTPSCECRHGRPAVGRPTCQHQRRADRRQTIGVGHAG